MAQFVFINSACTPIHTDTHTHVHITEICKANETIRYICGIAQLMSCAQQKYTDVWVHEIWWFVGVYAMHCILFLHAYMDILLWNSEQSIAQHRQTQIHIHIMNDWCDKVWRISWDSFHSHCHLSGKLWTNRNKMKITHVFNWFIDLYFIIIFLFNMNVFEYICFFHFSTKWYLSSDEIDKVVSFSFMIDRIDCVCSIKIFIRRLYQRSECLQEWSLIRIVWIIEQPIQTEQQHSNQYQEKESIHLQWW